MTDKQPEALRLADHLERFRSFPDDLAAAAELRRLHAELQATDRQVEILSDVLSECSKENEALRSHLTGAVNYIDTLGGVSQSYRAALARAGEVK